MSDRLTLSATLSVLIMVLYVLFGTEVPRVPIGTSEFRLAAEAVNPPSLFSLDGLSASLN